MIFDSVVDFVNYIKPLKGEFLALDVGRKKTGLAFTDGEGRFCIPSSNIYHSSNIQLIDEVLLQMQQKNAKYLVIGFPFAWEEGSSAIHINNIAKLFSSQGCIILLYDENGTSIKVKSTIYDNGRKMTKKQKSSYDSSVACLILSNALDEIKLYL